MTPKIPTINVNLNAIVSFRLTDAGRRIWRASIEDTFGMSVEDAVSQLGADLNPTTSELWSVMRAFGPKMRIGVIPFHDFSIQIAPNNGCVTIATDDMDAP